MIKVFTLGMSMPVSMMVVHTSTWISPSAICCITELSSRSAIFPWAMPMAASSPSHWRSRPAVDSMFSTRLCR